MLGLLFVRQTEIDINKDKLAMQIPALKLHFLLFLCFLKKRESKVDLIPDNIYTHF